MTKETNDGPCAIVKNPSDLQMIYIVIIDNDFDTAKTKWPGVCLDFHRQLTEEQWFSHKQRHTLLGFYKSALGKHDRFRRPKPRKHGSYPGNEAISNLRNELIKKSNSLHKQH